MNGPRSAFRCRLDDLVEIDDIPLAKSSTPPCAALRTNGMRSTTRPIAVDGAALAGRINPVGKIPDGALDEDKTCRPETPSDRIPLVELQYEVRQTDFQEVADHEEARQREVL